MILSAAEQQLIRIIRAAHRHDLTLAARVCDGRFTVRINTYDDRNGFRPSFWSRGKSRL